MSQDRAVTVHLLQKLDYYYLTFAEVLAAVTGASWDLWNQQKSANHKPGV